MPSSLNQANLQRTALSVLCCLLVVSCSSTSADKPPTEQIAQIGASTQKPIQVENEAIKVAYPSSNAVIPAASTFIAGATKAGTTVTCNGSAVHVTKEGFFAHVVQLKPGDNTFVLEQQPTGIRRQFLIKRELPEPPISADTFKIDPNQLQPNNDRGVSIGDMLEFSAHATPGSDVSAQIGKRRIVLRPAVAVARAAGNARSKRHLAVKATINPNINQGLDAAYGKVYQRRPAASTDLYVGFYKIQPDDMWKDLKPKYTLNHNGKTKSITNNIQITTITQPLLADTLHDKTVVRVGPGAGRITPLVEGVRLLVDGWQGDQMRVIYAPGHHFWIKKDDLNFETNGEQSGPAPNSLAKTINVAYDDYGTSLTVPLSQRLPYQVEQHLIPERLTLRIFGVTADTDWVVPALNDGHSTHLIKQITWKQASDGMYEINVDMKARQWGFYADYDGTSLVLHMKSPPKRKKPIGFHGVIVCVDPGHGGSETGAIGCSGVKESTINLGIALKLKSLLERSGARVIMTRTDDREVSLEERVDIANQAKADFLLSIHNNSLPDGRDPLSEHGTSTYWYHPQSIQLAKNFKEGLLNEVKFKDFGTRFQNLALTRPSSMLAVLVEVGFVVNPEEYAILISDEGQQSAAYGLLSGLRVYLDQQSRLPNH